MLDRCLANEVLNSDKEGTMVLLLFGTTVEENCLQGFSPSLIRLVIGELLDGKI